MRWIGVALMIIDCLVISFWTGGFVLLIFGKLHGPTYGAHCLIVLMTMASQLIWKFRCPLIIWKNQIMGTDDVLNPYLIWTIEKLFRVHWSTANKMLSGIIILGGTYYLLELFLRIL